MTAADLQHCADVVNSYRQQAGKPPLQRAADLEAFAAQASANDLAAQVNHQYWVSRNGGGVSLSENEAVLSLAEFQTIALVTDAAEKLFAAEGANGPHYLAMIGNFTQIGCGYAINGNAVLMANEFR